ncbi:hypothetical protein G0Q06_10665 [Puniceicoccales bacterium CK1056]|uniref:Lipoprotein n=1 Tax=Oceanipulchritudo coccoides TaxID=2706888 RepID=A0A6B2M481_9BACT|nr:hypothetical protein [Oceanipulchritudo coccoides]NDV62914.1 hypothetical protein [Oceanipulchritudo coccoides]
MKHTKTSVLGLIALFALLLAGCGGESNNKVTAEVTAEPVDQPTRFLLAEMPNNTTSLVSALESASAGDPVVVTGRIGGTLTPLSEDFAGFVLTDESVYFCDEGGEEGHCPTPWDACCEDPDKLAASRAFVQFVDDNGDPLPVNLRESAGLSENATVVVKGVLSIDSVPGNVVVIAEGMSLVE